MWYPAKSFVLALLLGLAHPASAASELSEQSRALERAVNAVVGVQALAVPDARSNATLGRIRQGSGVVIDPAGLVLTIGYLVLEADQIQLQLDDGRSLPARVAGYDIATGFGLLQSLAPLNIKPAPLGESEAVAAGDSLLIVSGAPIGELSAARLVSRRTFAGYWEYRIDGALFTAPPRTDHSGAGLFNPHGELVGIGSLVVADVGGSPGRDAPRMPGNMFVPTDLLRPILAELRRGGSTSASKRAWLGINCVEQGGKLHVVRVNDDSPADAAGLRVGDRIVGIDGAAVSSLDALWTRLWSGDAERDVQLEIERDDTHQSLSVRTVDRQRQLRRATGV
ncbi:MAG: S1C family serine protease [Aquincola sp.]|nr:S1C family serine protease [Aquincola sp.]MDH4287770.1 S1C family serine protease [Aquincola sp.]MDH5330120.1 S1C family serine protease [Aquincola sp.]